MQREDYKDRKNWSAPLPTANDKTSTESNRVSFCSLSQYKLRQPGDFLISVPFLRNSTPNIGGGPLLGGQKIRLWSEFLLNGGEIQSSPLLRKLY